MKLLLLFLQVVQILCDNVMVKISSGKVVGTGNRTTPKGNTYYAFRGMQYGRIVERFGPAVEPEKWDGIYNATKDGPICIQDQGSTSDQSEDCLFISVYTTKIEKTKTILNRLKNKFSKLFNGGNDNLPVMFWIHGGEFVSGDSRFVSWNPEYLLDEGVVVVTINYRLGIFGFLSTGDDVIPGNNGIKDIVLGLKWVQKNINTFGGDPKRVTIFGESAGAVIVSHLLTSPLTLGKGYFAHAIQQSGDLLMPWALQRTPQNGFTQLVYATNCFLSRNRVKCLKEVPTSVILNAQKLIFGVGSVFRLSILNGLAFAPVYENPNENAAVLNGSYTHLQDGEIERVPVIAGINSEEGLFIEQYLLPLRISTIQADFNFSILTPEDIHASKEDLFNFIQPAIKNYYFDESIFVAGTSDKNIIRYVSDTMFNKPWREYLYLTKNFVPTRCYYVSYIGTPSKNHYKFDDSRMGMVGHADELHYIWKDLKNVTLGENDLEIKTMMVKMWTNFAKTGNPTPVDVSVQKNNVLKGVIWPETAGSGTDVQCLNINQPLGIMQNPKEEQYKMWKGLYDNYGHPYDTY